MLVAALCDGSGAPVAEQSALVRTLAVAASASSPMIASTAVAPATEERGDTTLPTSSGVLSVVREGVGGGGGRRAVKPSDDRLRRPACAAVALKRVAAAASRVGA